METFRGRLFHYPEVIQLAVSASATRRHRIGELANHRERGVVDVSVVIIDIHSTTVFRPPYAGGPLLSIAPVRSSAIIPSIGLLMVLLNTLR